MCASTVLAILTMSPCFFSPPSLFKNIRGEGGRGGGSLNRSCALKNSDELARGLASALQSRYNGHFVFAKDLEKWRSRRGINSADDILERCSVLVCNAEPMAARMDGK